MRMIISGILLPAALLAFPHEGTCQVRAGSYQLSPSFGILWTDVSEKGFDLDSRSALLGINGSWNITRRLAAEGSSYWSPTQNQDLLTPLEVNIGLFDGGIVFHLMKSRFAPYVRGGGGFIHNFSEIMEEGPSEAFYTFGGGIKVLATEGGGLRLDIRDIVFSTGQEGQSGTTVHNLAASAAAVFQFGGLPPRDIDGDGVFDKKDECPETPVGAVVDERGCPIDSDGDGVSDGLDNCPSTPRDANVDRKGCPIDSDGDGSYDGLDDCPDTPAGARVNSRGCPKDTDGDGVYDGLDDCPDTPRGSLVDRNGCKLTEKEYQFFDTGLLRLEEIRFTAGGTEIDPAAHPLLDDVGRILSRWKELRVEIGGYTDSFGSESSNQRLSEKRANAVKDYILTRFSKIDPKNITVKGYGEANPIAPNVTADGREKNRRVEFKILNMEVPRRILEKSE